MDAESSPSSPFPNCMESLSTLHRMQTLSFCLLRASNWSSLSTTCSLITSPGRNVPSPLGSSNDVDALILSCALAHSPVAKTNFLVIVENVMRERETRREEERERESNKTERKREERERKRENERERKGEKERERE